MNTADFLKKITLNNRRLVIILSQTLLIPISYFFAFLLRFDFYIDQQLVIEPFLKTVPFLIAARLILFYYVDLFSGWWRYVSIEDITKIANAIVLSSLLFIACVVFLFGLERFPRSVFVIDALLLFFLLGGIRVATRMLRETMEKKKAKGVAKNVLIVGAGNTGITVVNEIKSNPDLNLKPVGFVDDDPQKRGYKIKNLKVLGSREDIPELVKRYRVDEVLIAIPSAPYKELHAIFSQCEKVGVPHKTLPGISKIITGKTFISQMRDVKPDELLGRPSVSFTNERSTLSQELTGKCVLVTGAGGSIGSELCRQIAEYAPSCLIMYERNEGNLFYIDFEMRKKFPHLNIVSVIGDILNGEKFDLLLTTYHPYIVYHAAAYKHVPLMERDPIEAVRNNFIGTKTISTCCVHREIPKFVFISTDKAVNPSSVMGTTKRMTEKLLQTYGQTPTKFISVRFGNVIGSSGSVIPLFKKQIAEGGPVTVTHPEATRFLMTIPEAVHLVLLAGAMGEGGEIFLLDMGEPANIAELAKSLIELSGLTPHKDIAIEYIGLREGEKLHEELYWEGEDILPTAHKKIRKLSKTSFNYMNYKLLIARLERAMEKPIGNEETIFNLIKSMVPEATISFANYCAHARAGNQP
ncbi:MAG: polysaccharide biosynthesis protein [Desulfobacterota bacterium]|nr:polysaccharide biosynthesis protein [Thermodesulfobacteriota bacterium]